VPLSKEAVLLTQYRHNLTRWRESIRNQYADALKALGARLGLLLGLLAMVFIAAELWRRAVLRYVREARRRYQLLLVRKIVLWALTIAIVGYTSVSELGSFVTFAGLITAGVAVAMQSVLVSVVGYFFLIGKYGIRIGDRVQIGSVTGEVIDLGLVRMHLMELGGQGPLAPTGRVVAFANSIVFQASGGLFKQIPGVNLAWHEITFTLPPSGDYAAIKDRITSTVAAIVGEYRIEIERQTQEIQRTASFRSGASVQPQVQLQFSSAEVQVLVRYPVSLEHAAEMDERVSQAVLRTITESSAAPAP
jgi:small-conductance mechanosensitive channel